MVNTLRWIEARMKKPGAQKVGEDIMSRREVETLIEIARAEDARERARDGLVSRLKSAYLDGDAALEHDLVRQLCGLPEVTTQ